MSFFKKTLASLGIGSARVDTILKQDVVYPGQSVAVDVHVYGGSTKQSIDNIHLKLCCRYRAERLNKDGREMAGQKIAKTHVLAKWSLPETFDIEPQQDRVFPVVLDVPWNTPITLGDSKVWLETSLDIALAADPTDKDEITVRPDPLEDGIFSALEEAGLRIRQVECEAVKGFELPFVQEFEFVPVHGDFHGRWRELEVVTYRTQDDLKIWFEVDRQKKGMGGMLSNLIGSNKLKRELVLLHDEDPHTAGRKVIEFLDRSS
ncbi:sporulation protein [Vibrio rumoiensis]|uniref:Sporulation control protein Spo0M n=1 Tax=Vibrio rumoiensis 1S-45 TaxID=1188252 RepID=A0A1E5E2Z9_9VIBR|nr:sporulation protein [Vibrio rumoiensis]OEF26049.1 sporulation control protein Spo0M [Vibrio rumoiensis 1S-45]